MRKYIPPTAKLIPDEAKLQFAGEIFEVYQWPQEMFDGSVETFEMLRRPDTVKIIAIKDDKIVLTRQRQPRTNWFYDFPGGRVDADDADELAAAKRELCEETGLKCKNWKLIEAHQPFGKLDWIVYTFIATDVISEEAPKLDNGEEISILEVDWQTLLEYSSNPKARYLTFPGMEKVGSIAELRELPAVYTY